MLGNSENIVLNPKVKVIFHPCQAKILLSENVSFIHYPSSLEFNNDSNSLTTFSSVTPDEWETFSNKNFLKAERECNSSKTLRSMIDEILQEVYNDQQKQCKTVNIALNKRIEETEKAKTKLENHLAKVMSSSFLCEMIQRFPGTFLFSAVYIVN